MGKAWKATGAGGESTMADMVTLTLPPLRAPDVTMPTSAGTFVVPGYDLPARTVNFDEHQVASLLAAAHEAAQHAHAPFSRFHVGAAVTMADDPAVRVFTGANVENSSYGGTVCAERSAIAAAASAGFRRIRYLAVSVRDALSGPLHDRSPCGLCRQVIREFADPLADPPGLVFIADGNPGALAQVVDIDRLLPWGFRFDPPVR